jgi:hypothetical protein
LGIELGYLSNFWLRNIPELLPLHVLQIGKNTNPYFFRELIFAINDGRHMEDNGKIDLVRFEDREGPNEDENPGNGMDVL